MIAEAATTTDWVVVPLGEFDKATLLGVVLPIDRTKPVDICAMMSDVIDENYTFAPTGVIDSIHIEDSVINLPDPVEMKFDLAIPLRHRDDRRNCLLWDRERKTWKKVRFSPNMAITGHHVMIIAAKRIEEDEES